MGFKWVVDSLRADHEHIASQIEIEWYATTQGHPTRHPQPSDRTIDR